MFPSNLKIISGGQTGADLGGLLAAEALGLKTGGFMPLGFKTEDGNYPEYEARFGMVAMETPNYVLRTIKNLESSDITIIFAYDLNSVGTKLTIKQCKQREKLLFIVSMREYTPEVNERIIDFLNKHQPKVVNIAGNRESKFPGLTEQVYQILYEILKKLLYGECRTDTHRNFQ